MGTEYNYFSYCYSKTPHRSLLETKGLFWLLVSEDFSPLEWGGMAGACSGDGRSFRVDQEAESTGRAGGKAPVGGLTFKGPPLEMDLHPLDRL